MRQSTSNGAPITSSGGLERPRDHLNIRWKRHRRWRIRTTRSCSEIHPFFGHDDVVARFHDGIDGGLSIKYGCDIDNLRIFDVAEVGRLTAARVGCMGAPMNNLNLSLIREISKTSRPQDDLTDRHRLRLCEFQG